ncbi:27523_t:CDS:2, partial [Gigaspora margarita]
MIGLKKKELELASPFVRQLNISLRPKYLLLENKLKTWIRTLRSSQKVASEETRNNDSCEDDNKYDSNEDSDLNDQEDHEEDTYYENESYDHYDDIEFSCLARSNYEEIGPLGGIYLTIYMDIIDNMLYWSWGSLSPWIVGGLVCVAFGELGLDCIFRN